MLTMTACTEMNEEVAGTPTRITTITSGGANYASRFNNEENKWEAGDAIGVFMLKADNSEVLNGAGNVLFATEQEGTSVSFKSEAGIPIASETASFYGYYPYSADIQSDKAVYPVRLSDQDKGFAAYDLMWAKRTGVTPEEVKDKGVSLTFTHQLALLKIQLTLGAGLSDVDNVTISGLNTSADFNLATGEMGEAGVLRSIKPYKSAQNYYQAIVLPTQSPQNMTINFYVGDTKYQYAMTSSTITEFKAGYQYLFKIGIGASVEGTLTEIMGSTTPWGQGETVENGSAGAVEDNSDIPSDYSQVLVDENTDMQAAMQVAAGKVAFVFDAAKTYGELRNLTLSDAVTEAMFVCEDKDKQAVVKMGNLSFGSSLQKLVFDNLEIHGEAGVSLCAEQSSLASQGVLEVNNCYLHDLKSVYSNGSESGNVLALLQVSNSRIYHAESVLNLYAAQKVTVRNSTLYDISSRAFYTGGDIRVYFTVEHCTLVKTGQTLFEAKGRSGDMVYAGNISNISAKNIAYGISLVEVKDSYAVSGSCRTIAKVDHEGIDASLDEASIFTHAGEEGDFTTTLSAGDPRWNNQ